MMMVTSVVGNERYIKNDLSLQFRCCLLLSYQEHIHTVIHRFLREIDLSKYALHNYRRVCTLLIC